jgi:hypothetical protein
MDNGFDDLYNLDDIENLYFIKGFESHDSEDGEPRELSFGGANEF